MPTLAALVRTSKIHTLQGQDSKHLPDHCSLSSSVIELRATSSEQGPLAMALGLHVPSFENVQARGQPSRAKSHFGSMLMGPSLCPATSAAAQGQTTPHEVA